MMNGYIKIDRSILYHPALQKRGQEFCEKGAFLWLLLEASFADREYRIKDKTIHLKRGQLCASLTFMAEAWGWDKSRVQRFLEKLKKFSTILTDTPNDTPSDTPDILTICHYDKYQDTPNDTPTDNKHNKITNKRNNNIDEIENAGEEWWKSFRFVGNNKGSKPKVMAFHKKNIKDKDLLKKIVETYNHYSDSQKEKSLSAPMVSTWINGKNWEHYEATPSKNDYEPVRQNNDARLKALSGFVKKNQRMSMIDDEMVRGMLVKKFIEQDEYDKWLNG